MNKRLHALARDVFCAGCLLAAAQIAHAAIVECRPTPGSYTVFLSEPPFPTSAFASKDQLRAFLQRLQFELDQGRDGQWVRSPSTDVRFVVCINRAPALDGSEFVPTLVETLHTGRVLLEVWGQLDATRDAGNPARLWAQINYLLVPIQFASNLNETAPRALQRLEYLDPQAPPPGDFVQLIARPLDIDAFVAAALGFKLLREKQRELAYSNLCRASSLLGQMTQRKMAPGTLKDLKALHAFVLACASRAAGEAQADAAYSKTGVLRLQDPKQPCAEEESR
jgi:hypothetical protein